MSCVERSSECLSGELSFGAKQRVSHDFLWCKMTRPHGLTHLTVHHFDAVWFEERPAHAIDSIRHTGVLAMSVGLSFLAMFFLVPLTSLWWDAPEPIPHTPTHTDPRKVPRRAKREDFGERGADAGRHILKKVGRPGEATTLKTKR